MTQIQKCKTWEEWDSEYSKHQELYRVKRRNLEKKIRDLNRKNEDWYYKIHEKRIPNYPRT